MSVLRINRRGYLPTFIDLGPATAWSGRVGGHAIESVPKDKLIKSTSPKDLERNARNRARRKAGEAT